ncbi:MAG TPA: hypothetical protein VFN13_12840 [Rudaea sp.]|nr:hypothetical protein [Rudaea sp.]
MNTEAASISSTRNVPIRWPFRILAGLVVLADIVATVGMVISGWHQGAAVIQWQLLASLPGLVWFGRLCWYAAFRGQSPAQESWPFASQRVFAAYVILWSVAMYA